MADGGHFGFGHSEIRGRVGASTSVICDVQGPMNSVQVRNSPNTILQTGLQARSRTKSIFPSFPCCEIASLNLFLAVMSLVPSSWINGTATFSNNFTPAASFEGSLLTTIIGWLIRVQLQGGSSGYNYRVVHQGTITGWFIRVQVLSVSSVRPDCRQQHMMHCYMSLFEVNIWAGAVFQRQRAGLLITGSLIRTHSGASFVINFASLSPASAWPSLA